MKRKVLMLVLLGGMLCSFQSKIEHPELEGLEIPVMKKDCAEQIIERMSYTCSYNQDNRCANWVAWQLTKEHATGPYVRKMLHIDGTYMEDEVTLKGRQRLSDWHHFEGYSHGHLCPAGDNPWSLEAMGQTFYLSNMCVQDRGLNSGGWNRLEMSCRNWAQKYGELYIVTGPIFRSNHHKTVGNNLHVPDAFFKVVLRLGNQPEAIGFIYENVTPVKGDRRENHVVTVDEVEEMTHMDFFSQLPDDIENDIESHANLSRW